MGGACSSSAYTRVECFKGRYGRVNYAIDGSCIGQHEFGKIIICLHGLNSHMGQFNHISKFLVPVGYTVIRMDFYGHGESSSPSKTKFSGELYCDQILQLLDHLHIQEKVNLMAFSMGGCIAAIFTTKYPEKVRAVSLFAPAGMISERIPILSCVSKCSYCIVPFGPCCVSQCCVKDDNYANVFQSKELNEALSKNILTLFRSRLRRNIRTLMQASRGVPLWSAHTYFEQLGALNAKGDVKVAFFWGRLDFVVPPKDSIEFLKQKFGSSLRFLWLDGVGHQIIVERVRALVIESHKLFSDQFPCGQFSNGVDIRRVFIPPPRQPHLDILSNNTIDEVVKIIKNPTIHTIRTISISYTSENDASPPISSIPLSRAVLMPVKSKLQFDLPSPSEPTPQHQLQTVDSSHISSPSLSSTV